MPRKRRTRQHVIADLSANHGEYYALRCGFSVERAVHDYGIDLVLFTYNDEGEVENGQVFMQLKATDHLRLATRQQAIRIGIKRADLELWLAEPV